MTVRYLLDRSSETASRDEPSQDYLVIETSPSAVCFAVTDGVGSSFFGELAAQILAVGLVDWLSALPAVPGEDRLTEQLTDTLHALSDEVRDLIERYPIPAHVTGVVQSVLEQQRAYGSEAMFACGRIDRGSVRSPKVGLAWLGDTRLRVQLDTMEESSTAGSLDLTGNTADRWSTSRGPRGLVRSWVRPAGDVLRVTACSDGLLPELEATLVLSDRPLDARLLSLAGDPNSDDMAFVDIGLRRTAIPPREDNSSYRADKPSPEHPQQIQARDREDRVRLATSRAAESSLDQVPQLAAPRWRSGDRGGRNVTWTAVEGANSYTVEVAENPAFVEPITYEVVHTEFSAPRLPTRYWIRVRAHSNYHVGLWSEPLEQPDPSLPHQRINPNPAEPARQQPTREPSRRDPPSRASTPGIGSRQQDVPLSTPEGSSSEVGRRSEPDRPIIRICRFDRRTEMLELAWDPVQTMQGYVLRIEPTGTSARADEYRLKDNQAQLVLRPGWYRISVRANRVGDETSWSPSVEAEITD